MSPRRCASRAPPAYSPLTGRRDTRFGIDAGSPAFVLDDPDSNTWVMKSVSLITHPEQTYEGLTGLGDRLSLPLGWAVRAVVFDADLILTPDNAPHGSPRTTLATSTPAPEGHSATTDDEKRPCGRGRSAGRAPCGPAGPVLPSFCPAAAGDAFSNRIAGWHLLGPLGGDLVDALQRWGELRRAERLDQP
jgi:hypothetical protein